MAPDGGSEREQRALRRITRRAQPTQTAQEAEETIAITTTNELHNVLYIASKGQVEIPFPIPDNLSCECGRSYKHQREHKRIEGLINHFSTKHWCNNPEAPAPVAVLRCSKCGYKGSTSRTLQAHECNTTKPPPQLPVTEMIGNKLIIPYPAGPSRCHLCDKSTTQAKSLAGVSAFFSKHFYRKHGLLIDYSWKCIKCGHLKEEYHMSTHICSQLPQEGPSGSTAVNLIADGANETEQEPLLIQSPQLVLPSSTPLARTPIPGSASLIRTLMQRLSSTPIANGSLRIDDEAVANKTMSSHSEPDSSSISATINPTNQVNNSLQAETEGVLQVPQVSSNLATDAPYSDDVITSADLTTSTNDGEASRLTSQDEQDDNDVFLDATSHETGYLEEEETFLEPEEHPEMTVHHVLGASPAIPTASGNAASPQPDVAATQRDWVAACAAISTTQQLEQLILDLQREIESMFPQEKKRPREDVDRRASGQSRRRNQKRQLQREKINRKRVSEEASRIQKEFNLYPGKAVRKALCETSDAFSGDVEKASEWLQATYNRPIPNNAQAQRAKELFDNCTWQELDEDDFNSLNHPPTKDEIFWKLKRTKNTSPGADGIEYRHLKKLDKSGQILEALYAAIWRLRIPDQWKMANTILIHKKGSTDDVSNFRPISLLSTLYKLFSGIMAARLTDVAVKHSWISPEQKGFLPGVRGIQEHTQLLQMLVDAAKKQRHLTGGELSITWLDLRNAFGSIPHRYLTELFNSLPIPPRLRELFIDIYTNNRTAFILGKSTVEVSLTTGVRQGDALSAAVFLLAAEPLVRAAKQSRGITAYGGTAKTSSFADDMAVISSKWQHQQPILDILAETASTLGMEFNAGKCVNLSYISGEVADVLLLINGERLRCLKESEREEYLGIPIGGRFMFRPHTDLVEKLEKLNASLLAPWQKLEVYRAYLLPSLCHHLGSGKVESTFLKELDRSCLIFLRSVAEVPENAVRSFFYADRRVGGLGTPLLREEGYVWTLARAAQLLDSRDPAIRAMCRNQLDRTLMDALPGRELTSTLRNAYLSDDTKSALMREVQFGKAKTNLWTRARLASRHLKVRIDVSDDANSYTRLNTQLSRVVDDVSAPFEQISVESRKAVRGLRTALRQRKTVQFIQEKYQGRVARMLSKDSEQVKDITRLISCRTDLTFDDWRYFHRGRLGLLPVRAKPGSQCAEKTCRKCMKFTETVKHVANGCPATLEHATRRHNSVQSELVRALTRSGHEIDERPMLGGLRPDIVVTSTSPPTIIDVAVVYDEESSMQRKHQEKMEKYRHLGPVLPFIVGSYGSWFVENSNIMTALDIRSRTWQAMRRRCRLSAIQGTTQMVKIHLNDGVLDEQLNDAEDYLPPCPSPRGSSVVAHTAGPYNMASQALGVSDSSTDRGVSARCCVAPRGTVLRGYVHVNE